MIVSHKHRFIFLKTNKTAGTSVEIALSKFCGPDDVIPPLIPEDEAKRAELGYRGAQNYHVPYSEYDLREWWRLIRKRHRRRYHSHMLARDVKRFVPGDVWDSYFKFAFERNPWDRAVSLYYWKYPQEPRPTFHDFLRSDEVNRLTRKGRGLYSIDGEIILDHLYKFEDLQGAMADVAERLKLPEVPELPHAKGNTRKKKGSYQEMYSEEDAKIIADLFEDEIGKLGYQFQP